MIDILLRGRRIWFSLGNNAVGPFPLNLDEFGPIMLREASQKLGCKPMDLALAHSKWVKEKIKRDPSLRRKIFTNFEVRAPYCFECGNWTANKCHRESFGRAIVEAMPWEDPTCVEYSPRRGRKLRPCFQNVLQEGPIPENIRDALIVEYCLSGLGADQILGMFRIEDIDRALRMRPYRCKTLQALGYCLGEGCSVFLQRRDHFYRTGEL